ncbi:hypothetical protein BO71DRAFT_428881 [Aspergillus ellipticus CBS 707.79]|uniref:Uncharacterized protein n=1 Tax=Aspergillus ellipticus CBS 707.79 TaxID=1448320 RepID=A0A319DE06_9EURO|nr:hypothetical protein BO71DRAFT_428881 [Aspergillus ellipticus CBS 707.79]
MIPFRSFYSSLAIRLVFITYFTICLSTATIFVSSDDSDLVSYVTLPDHRVLKCNITYYDRQAVAPGYWFVAPYWITGGEPYTNRWMPYQIGPYIFDQDGTVIGLDLENANGTVLNNRYQITGSTPVNDKHEFYVYAPGRSLAIHHRREVVDLWKIGMPGVPRLVKLHGFRDIDYTTGEIFFEWDSQGHVPLDESFIAVEAGPPDDPADYLHANSVEKTKDKNGTVSLNPPSPSCPT